MVQPVARLVPTHKTTQPQNKRTQTSMPQVKSNPRSQRSSEQRQFMPETARLLWTVIYFYQLNQNFYGYNILNSSYDLSISATIHFHFPNVMYYRLLYAEEGGLCCTCHVCIVSIYHFYIEEVNIFLQWSGEGRDAWQHLSNGCAS
jgi:hypothetical protein